MVAPSPARPDVSPGYCQPRAVLGPRAKKGAPQPHLFFHRASACPQNPSHTPSMAALGKRNPPRLLREARPGFDLAGGPHGKSAGRRVIGDLLRVVFIFVLAGLVGVAVTVAAPAEPAEESPQPSPQESPQKRARGAAK